MKPIVAIIGRPNVGKSALFNRLIRRRQALVDATPSLTRDRLYADVSWGGREFQVVDTGGLIFSRKEPMAGQIASQVARAMEEASAALFVVDTREGPMPLDQEISSWVRRWGKPVLLVANKVDTDRDAPAVPEFAGLGLGPAHPVSALHGRGIGDLLDAVVERLKSLPAVKPAPESPGAGPEPTDQHPAPSPRRPLRVAFVGRPNVGKSSLVNRILNEERVLVDAAPGTTRDPVEARFSYQGRAYQLVDTAGIRAKRTLQTRMDAVARLKALEVLRQAHVCVGVLEAPVGLVHDDLRLLDEVVMAGRPLVLAVNKWDLLPRSTDLKSAEQGIARRAPFVRFASVVCTSAKTGFHVLELLERIAEAEASANRRLEPAQTKALLEVLREDTHAPAGVRNAHLIRLSQVGVAPPCFQLLARVRSPFRESDVAYLERVIRLEHGFQGTPVRFRILQKSR